MAKHTRMGGCETDVSVHRQTAPTRQPFCSGRSARSNVRDFHYSGWYVDPVPYPLPSVLAQKTTKSDEGQRKSPTEQQVMRVG